VEIGLTASFGGVHAEGRGIDAPVPRSPVSKVVEEEE